MIFVNVVFNVCFLTYLCFQGMCLGLRERGGRDTASAPRPIIITLTVSLVARVRGAGLRLFPWISDDDATPELSH